MTEQTAEPIPRPHCGICRFGHFANQPYGQCRIRAPRMRNLSDNSALNSLGRYDDDRGLWPRVERNDFCGEFEKEMRP